MSLPHQYHIDSYLNSIFIWLENKNPIAYWLFAFFLGALLSRVFAPNDIFPLLFIIAPFWLLAIDRAKSGKQIFSFGWWIGFGLFSIGLNWIGYSFTQQEAVPAFLAPFAILGLAGLLSIYIGLVVWFTWLIKVNMTARIFIFAAIWTLMEITRGILFTGFPWHIIGSMWANWLPVAQSASYISVYGLSFISMIFAGSFICFFIKEKKLSRFTFPIVSISILIAATTAGYLSLKNSQTHFHTSVSLRLVQANVKQREKWLSYLIENHLDKHMGLSRHSSPSGKADGIKLLIWPETSVQRQNFDREGSIPRWRLSRLLERGSYALVGAPRYVANQNSYDFYNSLFAVNYKGEIHAKYDKKHLVPFGEYLPFENILNSIGLSQLTGGSAFKNGDQNTIINLPGVPPFSPLICYEVIFPGGVVTATNNNRPQWLLNITNDGWFGLTEGPYQHLALARFRAIEEGLPLVRNAGGGISAVIDPYGRTISQLGLDHQGIVNSVLPKALNAPMVPVYMKIIILIISTLSVIIGAYALGRDKKYPS